MKTLPISSLIRFFIIGGVVGIIAGLIHLTSGLTTEFTSTIIGDTIINTVMGLLSLVAAGLLTKAKQAVIFIVALEMLGAFVYGFAVGRGVNYFIIIIGGYLIWQLYTLKQKGELN